ncbi:MAG: hypothetical protein ACREPD_09795 [Stenotrophomonas sp.]|uniref:hypothetical protein n=1 Tax=Stenotrophomonas sp. TaxID=69392 RepID=UPI003D6D9C7D
MPLLLLFVIIASAPAAAHAKTGASTCMRLTQTVARGDAFSRENLELAECSIGEALVPVHYDGRERLARATRDMLPGQTVPRIDGAKLARARRGEEIVVLLINGPITIARRASVLRDCAGGDPVLVAMGDGVAVALRAEPAKDGK